MNTETSDTITASLNGAKLDNTVHRAAQRAHEAVDSIEQAVSSSSEKVLTWHQEYGDKAREQVRANPIAVVAGAFFAGWLFAKITR